MKNITRREAAKAVALGTAAAFVAPTALAETDPDAEILALKHQRDHILNVEIPPLEKEFNDAEAKVSKRAPFPLPPRRTMAQIDAEEAKDRARLKDEGRDGDAFRLAILARFGDVDGETAIRQKHEPWRAAVRQYEAEKTARLQAEKEVGLFEKEQRLCRADERADAIREKILATPARTEAGYLIKLEIAMEGLPQEVPDLPDLLMDKALNSLLRDLQAGA